MLGCIKPPCVFQKIIALSVSVRIDAIAMLS
nr:MAG TPA: hypothetical protein [Caudoviricetes sp.]